MDDLSKRSYFIRVKHKHLLLVEEKLRDIHNLFAVRLEKIVSPRTNPRFALFSLETEFMPAENLEVLLSDVQVNSVVLRLKYSLRLRSPTLPILCRSKYLFILRHKYYINVYFLLSVEYFEYGFPKWKLSSPSYLG